MLYFFILSKRMGLWTSSVATSRHVRALTVPGKAECFLFSTVAYLVLLSGMLSHCFHSSCSWKSTISAISAMKPALMTLAGMFSQISFPDVLTDLIGSYHLLNVDQKCP